jgi:hypothetical protein
VALDLVKLAGNTGYPWSLALLAQLVEHLHGKEGVDGSSPSEGSEKIAANQVLLLALVATDSDLDVHRASTARRERLPRALETESLRGFVGLRFDVHPASTARSSASASRSETACSWLSTARWP